MAIDEEYLGDGLYVYWDGWQIRLRAPRENGDHMVFLEPLVLMELEKYIRRIKDHKNKNT
jgi:hypothetical protein